MLHALDFGRVQHQEVQRTMLRCAVSGSFMRTLPI
jgi:hypothetical protein